MKIYHNPRCSKSRQTLQLITDAGVTPEIILYLETGITAVDLSSLVTQLGFSSARELMRKGEAEYKELNLKSETDDAVLIAAMAKHPRLLERPIVVAGKKAVLGRPPENVLALL